MQRAAVAVPLPLLPLLAVAAMHGAAVARHKAAHHEPAVAAMHGAAVAHGDGPRAGMQRGISHKPTTPHLREAAVANHEAAVAAMQRAGVCAGATRST